MPEDERKVAAAAANDEEEDTAAPAEKKTDAEEDPKAARMQRMRNLRMRMNQAINQNKEASMEEYRRRTEGEAEVEKRKRKEAWQERKRQHEKDVAEGLVEEENPDLAVTAAQASEREAKRRKKEDGVAGFGWDMFNVDTQVKTTEKRLANIHDSFGDDLQTKYAHDKASFEANPAAKQNIEYGIVSEPTDEMRMRLKTELAVTTSRRQQFSRRRAFDDSTCDYIDERNRKFNQKLERTYGHVVKEIRENLERGTAL